MTTRPIGAHRATLAVEVRSEIERMIVSGELAAGEKMNELILSNAMGVSRGTVREAIRSLADSGLIDLVANRGAFVHETTLPEVRNLYELRGAVFSMACAAAARGVAEGQQAKLMDRLERNVTQMQHAIDQRDKSQYYTLNIDFHDMLLVAAGNPRAKTIYDNLVKEMHLYRRRGLSVPTNMERSLQEHIRIKDAVAAGQPEQARAAAHNHITEALTRYMALLETNGDVE